MTHCAKNSPSSKGYTSGELHSPAGQDMPLAQDTHDQPPAILRRCDGSCVFMTGGSEFTVTRCNCCR
jgi:hypothetical protein